MISQGDCTENAANTLNVVDLFSGVGGLSLGTSRTGFTIRGAVDIELQALNAHTINFPNTKHINTDITNLTGSALKSKLNLGVDQLAGVIGGPPCQGFSTIGRRAKDDTRNQLFVEFFRIVSEARPSFFLAENVPGILADTYNATRDHALSLVDRDYCVLPPMEFAAHEYGAPTTRKRIFFFGYRTDELRPLTLDDFRPRENIQPVYVKDALRGLPTRIEPSWQKEEESWRVVRTSGEDSYSKRLFGHIPPGVGDQTALARLDEASEVSGCLGTAHSTAVATRYGNVECGKYDPISKSYRLLPDGFCPTLRAGTGPAQGSFQAVRPIHPTEPRVITPREAARLQGFPDWFQFSPTKWHSFRQIGNSVSPILAEEILSVVSASLGIVDAERPS